MDIQEVRDEVSRQHLLNEGTRLIQEIDRFKSSCLCCGFFIGGGLDAAKAPIYAAMEQIFPPDLKEKLKIVS